MTKRLLNKFIWGFGSVLLWLLVSPEVIAGIYPLADTCQNPEPPVITGSAKAICRSESVQLVATGCAGTVVWSNGEIGDNITVKPQQTTKYTAICRARPGCISCFAEVWKVTVNTPDAPIVKPASALICANDIVTLTASNCAGTVHWQNQNGDLSTSGTSWTGNVAKTTVFQATCEQNNCVSNPSKPVSIQAALPTIPTIIASQREICAGQNVTLTASGCSGSVRWSDGATGLVRNVTPYQATTYRTVCQLGSCQSDSSSITTITVRSAAQKLDVVPTLSNACPYQTADLSKAILATNAVNGITTYRFLTSPNLSATQVQSPGAVLAGTYYLAGRNAQGCFTEPTAVKVAIGNCLQAIAPCLSNPPTVAIRLDSVNWEKGVIQLQAQLGGSATTVSWQSDGGGLFTNSDATARYLLSETDRQRGTTLFTVATSDPDGNGPCVAAVAKQVVAAPLRNLIGLSKKISEPVWVTESGTRFVELTYQFTTHNFGNNTQTNVQISDDLESAFTSVGAQIHSVNVRTDDNLTANATYSGRGNDTLLVQNGTLEAGAQAHAWLTIRLDVSQASTLTFANTGIVKALDANGATYQDYSTNGTEADPDRNGNPADNAEPTLVTLHSIRSEETETVFIPEGFSPNDDGINDRFVIQRLPQGSTVQLEVYNRWGQLVYQSNDYKNDWDGTANRGLKTSDAKQALPDGTYYYQIRLNDGREYVRFLTLVR
ncbi:gliding motility-associated C-terminal domain-containing protein [Spirosoma sp. BT702]|uniref:Gliding motility-associated C-terminal domain-containing protein n=1 Tax=Spirosoma profusum TaxID=2771354 RepID=A0A926Y0D0_9BACT|nr:gliding motility-associated C-terminal domain-containing protein [Spirosoma profusum]MBD2699620.1 gliding motility-associated C-terminal domain-containing protein [Spirosoma profusum]